MSGISQFLESYRATWEAVIRGSEQVAALSSFFDAKCFMLAVDGTVKSVQSNAEIDAFNEGRLISFREGQVDQCTFRGIDTISQGPHATLAIVNWELKCADGSLERAWRHYYTIAHTKKAPRILVSAFQTGAGL